jgi:periplasmic protein TonB
MLSGQNCIAISRKSTYTRRIESMEPKEKMNPQQFIIDRLHEIQKKIEAGKFDEALENLKEVKSADAKNIYIIAIERQIVKATDPTITEKNKSDITNSLPAMFERAVSDTQRRAEALKQAEIKTTKGKEAALEKLKSQYFQRTDDYVAKGDYAHALEEIRRIYIIEPDSVVAKEYEQKIEQLAKLQQKSEESPSEEKEAKEEEEAPPKKTVPQTIEPLQPAETAPKSKTPLIAGLVVMAAVIGVVIFFVLSSRKKSEEPAPPVAAAQQQSASQTPAAAPAEVKENGPAKEAEEEKPKQSELKKQESKLAAAAVQQKLQAAQKQAAPAAANQAGSKAGSNPATTTASPAPTGAPTTSAAQPPVQQQPAAPQQSGPIDAPHPFVAIENPIQILKLAAPSYPEIAYRMGLNGKVIVEVTVDQQGKPIQATIAKSTSDIFNDASISAAMKSTYKPAMMSTGPVTAKVYVPFTFKIGR